MFSVQQSYFEGESLWYINVFFLLYLFTERLWGALCRWPVPVSQQPLHLTEVAVRRPRRLQDGGRWEKLPGNRYKNNVFSFVKDFSQVLVSCSSEHMSAVFTTVCFPEHAQRASDCLNVWNCHFLSLVYTWWQYENMVLYHCPDLHLDTIVSQRVPSTSCYATCGLQSSSRHIPKKNKAQVWFSSSELNFSFEFLQKNVKNMFSVCQYVLLSVGWSVKTAFLSILNIYTTQ